jgi:hypothetical protein
MVLADTFEQLSLLSSYFASALTVSFDTVQCIVKLTANYVYICRPAIHSLYTIGFELVTVDASSFPLALIGCAAAELSDIHKLSEMGE